MNKVLHSLTRYQERNNWERANDSQKNIKGRWAILKIFYIKDVSVFALMQNSTCLQRYPENQNIIFDLGSTENNSALIDRLHLGAHLFPSLSKIGAGEKAGAYILGEFCNHHYNSKTYNYKIPAATLPHSGNTAYCFTASLFPPSVHVDSQDGDSHFMNLLCTLTSSISSQ